MKKILFIEDETTLQKAIGRYLEQEGYQIKNALDGDIGLKIAKKEKPDLILLDIILPKKNGFEVLKELNLASLFLLFLIQSLRQEHY